MMAFIKTLLIVLLVYYGLKFLFRLVKPYLLRYISKKANQQFEKFFGNMTAPQKPHKPEGAISIDKMPKRNSPTNKKVGEYVDFEEVD